MKSASQKIFLTAEWRYLVMLNYEVDPKTLSLFVPTGTELDYWGYATQRDGSIKEYLVEHPRWDVWETQAAEFNCETANLYGESFYKFFNRPPSSAFLADGSKVKVYKGVKLKL